MACEVSESCCNHNPIKHNVNVLLSCAACRGATENDEGGVEDGDIVERGEQRLVRPQNCVQRLYETVRPPP